MDKNAMQARFHEAFKTRGGLLTERVEGGAVEFHRPRLDRHLTQCMADSILQPGLRATYFDCVNNPNMNACAFRPDTIDFLAIHRGLIGNLSALFRLLLSHPRILPDVGDASQESDWFDDLSHVDWLGDQSILAVRSRRPSAPSIASIPRDDDRRSLATMLAAAAIDLVFFHELGHIALGHLDYEKDSGGTGLLQEVDFKSCLSAKRQQLIELNADQHAIWLMRRAWDKVTGAGQIPPTALRFPFTYAHKGQVVSTWITAACVLFFIMDRSRGMGAYKDTTHPHPAIRLIHAWDCSSPFASEIPVGDKVVRVDPSWLSAMGACAEIFELLGMPSSVLTVCLDEPGTLAVFRDYFALRSYGNDEFFVEIEKYNRIDFNA